ncbi:hypothetical protein BH11ARM2_BH11ARM2_00210 [soil metagenome]
MVQEAFSDSDRAVLRIIQRRLGERFEIKRMVLFGSRVTGRATAESDYDVLVVTESDIPFVERQGLALLALGKRDFPLDLLVYTSQEAEREAHMLGSAVYWAEREGKEFLA